MPRDKYLVSMVIHYRTYNNNINNNNCSGMMACACGMCEWLFECESVCRQMDE